MFNPEKKIGASLLVMGLMLNVNEAFAQTTPTCVKAPTCEELGYDKVASDCGELAKLRCPFDPDKYFCTAYTDLEGNMPIAVGDVVYSDGTYGSPAIKQPNKIPIGVVFSTTGNKFVALETHGHFYSGQKLSCSGYEAGGFTNWSSPIETELKTMFKNKETINATLASLSETALGGSYAYKVDNYDVYYVNMESGVSGSNFSNSYPTRCVNSIGNITSEKPEPSVSYKVGDTYIKDGEPVGTIVEIDSSGEHGVVAFSGGVGTLDNASLACASKTTGNLSWSLATGAHSCQILKTSGSRPDYSSYITCGVHTMAGQGACTNSNWYPFTSALYPTSCNTTDSLAFVCEAAF